MFSGWHKTSLFCLDPMSIGSVRAMVHTFLQESVEPRHKFRNVTKLRDIRTVIDF